MSTPQHTEVDDVGDADRQSPLKVVLCPLLARMFQCKLFGFVRYVILYDVWCDELFAAEGWVLR